MKKTLKQFALTIFTLILLCTSSMAQESCVILFKGTGLFCPTGYTSRSGAAYEAAKCYLDNYDPNCHGGNYPLGPCDSCVCAICFSYVRACSNGDFYIGSQLWQTWDVICGADSDNDGLIDPVDNCPNDPYNDVDHDSICGDIDICPNDPQNDVDDDGICGDIDNCPNVFNPSQRDSDNNGKGDACDFEGFQTALETRLKAIEQALQNCGCMEPTNINLSSLKALSSNKKVALKWQTESEPDNAGFNIWRAEGFVKVNGSMMPALGSTVSGSEYNFVDEWVLNGKRYFYLLEDIDTNGISTFHGPVDVIPRWRLGLGR